MPFDGNGIFSLPGGSTAVTGATILASTHNNPVNDIASALSQTLLRSGVAPMSGNLNLNSNRITNLAAGSSAADAVRLDQVVVKDAGAAQTITRTAAGEILALASTDAGAALGPVLTLFRDSASPAAADAIGGINFDGEDSAGNQTTYARISATITDATDGTEDGVMSFGVITAGSFINEMILRGDSLYPTVNDGLALGTATLSFADLFLASGAVVNFNNGNYTITHSAGDLLFSGGVSIGNADTTLSRASAGDLNVEGNLIYRAGGTDVPIADGGTGASTAAAAAAAILAAGVDVTMTGAAILKRDGSGTAGNTVMRLERTDGTVANGSEFVDFHLTAAGGQVGSITINTGTGNVAYNATSDGRLKPEEHRRPIANSGEIIDALNPIYFRWAAGAEDYGFIAQEVHAVLPNAATPGEGEPGDEDFKPWSLAVGRMEAIHTAELQSLRKRVATLEAMVVV